MRYATAISGIICMACVLRAESGGQAKALTLVDWSSSEVDIGAVEKRDVEVSIKNGSLEIRSGHAVEWPGITLKAPAGEWNLSGYQSVACAITNTGANQVSVCCRIDNPGGDGQKNCVTERVTLEPGKSEVLSVSIAPPAHRVDKDIEFVGMRGYPTRKGRMDAEHITQIIIFVPKPQADHVFAIGTISAVHGNALARTFKADTFLPFVDGFGQFRHADWPGKIHAEEELRKNIEAENVDLKTKPGPSCWDKYGGWAEGPQLKATGFFRAEKHEGKWWLVDPDGRLFWSHGIDCVHSGSSTPISLRENYFAELPDKNSPFSQFYGTGTWAPQGYYKDHVPYKVFDFAEANLYRKFGESWRQIHGERVHARLKSWGMNTIGNWSDENIYLQRKTPYTVAIHCQSKPIQGSSGYWGKFPDPFDPEFRKALKERFAKESGKSADDPWCVGYFVDNELDWGDATGLAEAVLASPPEQCAKKVFVEFLREKYKNDISALNAAWGADYPDWNALLPSVKVPDKAKAGADLGRFYAKIAETYFKTIKEELEAIAPSQLYLGCRFAWANDAAVAAAARYCDVITFNIYEYRCESKKLPGDLDMPLLIGEFHFGALDRGLFHTGLKEARDQNDRARLYNEYVSGALRNPQIVGTHWFQYKDQPLTGRGDGENYQIGFLDICDNPYAETVEASRKVAGEIYKLRIAK